MLRYAVAVLCQTKRFLFVYSRVLTRVVIYSPREEANTTPKPTANGPPMFKNFSLGAHMATVDRPPTMPAVYHAALIISGPPRRVRGAMTAPITPYQYMKKVMPI